MPSKHDLRPVGGRGQAVGRRRSRPDIKQFALVFATHNLSQPNDMSQLASSFTRLGHRSEVWLNRLRKRIRARGGDPSAEIVFSGNRVQFLGEAVIDMCAMFDLVHIGHWWPESFVQAVKARSKVGTRVLLRSNFESINQRRPFSGNGITWLALRPESMLVADVNTYGDFCIDKFETTNQTGGRIACPHTPSHAGLPDEATVNTSHNWDIDVYAATGNGIATDAATVALVANWVNELTAYPGGSIAGYWFDNLLENPFKGSATNDYPAGWTSDYRAGWNAFGTAFNRALPGLDVAYRLWPNGPLLVGSFPAATFPNRYVEHYFRNKGWTDIAADLEAIKSNGLRVVLGINGTIGNAHYWATTTGGFSSGTWDQLVGRIRSLRLVDDVYVASWQTFNTAYLYYQEGFRVPT